MPVINEYDLSDGAWNRIRRDAKEEREEAILALLRQFEAKCRRKARISQNSGNFDFSEYFAMAEAVSMSQKLIKGEFDLDNL